MKKNLILTTFAAGLMLLSCTGGQNVFVINGKAVCDPAVGSNTVYMYDGRSLVDSAAVDARGRFRFKGEISDEKYYALVLDESHQVVLIPDVNEIEVVLGDSCLVKGSPLTDRLAAMDSELETFDNEEDFYGACRRIYNENSGNIIGYIAFNYLAYEIDIEEYDRLMETAGELIRNDEKLSAMRSSKKAAADTGVGAEMRDFEGLTPGGQSVKLSDYVGKSDLTLVDFWASWCGPCMRSMPGMKALYDRYAKKGLQIVGVAVWDGDNSRSLQKMDEKGMTWPQIFVGDDKTPTDIYGIQGIPHVILFDKNGTILLRGIPDEEELAETIGKLL